MVYVVLEGAVRNIALLFWVDLRAEHLRAATQLDDASKDRS